MRKSKSEEYLNYIESYVPTYFTPFQSTWKPIELIKPPTKELSKTTPNPFDPKTFKEFVGQTSAKEILTIIVDSANKEKRLIPNILLTGAFGHGKTTLAKLIAKRHRKNIELVDGSIAGTVIAPSTNTIYIVDEAHNIPAQLADTYNILIDENRLRLIACTTNPGGLSSAFRSRFRSIYLTSYTPEDIKTIIQRAAKRAKLKIEPKAAANIGKRAKLNPRNALTLLSFIREIAVLSSKEEITITEVDVNIALAKLNVDMLGLTELDRKYLQLLKYDRPVGVNYIASVLSLDTETIQEEIEPYLIQIGLVERTPKGRLLGHREVFKSLEKRIIEESRNFIP